MSLRVFISYRRDDAKWEAREIYRSLTQVLPRDHVFMDLDSIPPGADFVDVLEGWVDECDILLALIGSGWIDAMDPKTARRRLENPNDFVRIEVRKALERGIPVVPVLLDGAPIPDAERLPDDLKKLTRRNAEFVEHRTVDSDVERLIRRLGLAETKQSQMVEPPAADNSVHPHQHLPPQAAAAQRRKIKQLREAEGKIPVDAPYLFGVEREAGLGWFCPGAGKTQWFQDLDIGPEMVVVPAGSFLMGSPENEPERGESEGPQHTVTIAKPFAVGRHAITRGQFATFVSDTGHKTEGGAGIWTGSEWEPDPKASWRSPGFQQDDSHPVVCINWDDAKAYTAWLSKKTGKTYRLLLEAEWEYAARAGTTTPFWWGASITPSQANYDGNFVYQGGGSKGEWRQATVPVGSFEANPWGLLNVHGNSWEWCEDVWHDDYNGAPSDGLAWLGGGNQGRRVARGGSWDLNPQNLRSANRYGINTDLRGDSLGFRLGRTLTP